MSDKGFTSGERRGLIVLLVLMALIVGWSIVSRSCSTSTSRELNEKIITVKESEYDSVNPGKDSIEHNTTVKKSKHSQRQKKKNNKPVGKKRNYLDEIIDE